MHLAHGALAAAARAEWTAAAELLREAEAAGPRGRDWLQVALAALELGEREACARALAQAVDANASNPAAHLFRGLLHYDQGEFQEALQALSEARRLKPDNQAVPTARALVHLGHGKLAEAVEALCPREGRGLDLSVSPPIVGRLAVAVERRLLPLELPDPTLVEAPADPPAPPGEPPAAGLLARVRRSFLHWRLEERGRSALQRAWKRHTPGERRKDLEEAVEAFRAAREAEPRAFRASYHVGEALLCSVDFGRPRDEPPGPDDLARVREAEACFRQSARDDSSNPYVLHYLARTAFLQRRFAEAEERWRRALEGFEKFPEAHYGLGLCLLAQGRERDARYFLLQSFLSDLHLLRERLRELARVFRERPEALAAPAEFPLPAAPSGPRDAEPVVSSPGGSGDGPRMAADDVEERPAEEEPAPVRKAPDAGRHTLESLGLAGAREDSEARQAEDSTPVEPSETGDSPAASGP